MAGRLSIEKLAAYRAAIEAGENREAVLRQIGETVATWAEQEEQILAELANEADRGAFQRIEAYQAAYNAAWAGWVTASSCDERSSAAEPFAQVPPADLDTTSELARTPVQPALPFAAGTTQSSYARRPAGIDPQETREAAESLESTGEVASSASRPAVLPFESRAADPVTRELVPSADVFAAATSHSSSAPAGQDARATELLPGPGADDLEGTRELAGGLLPGPTLPFGGASSTIAPTPANAAPRFAMRTGTEDVDVFKLRAGLLPFEARQVTAGAAMTVEAYARLRASLTVNGEQHAPTWAEFGISSQQDKDALQQRFAAVFRGDPEVQARFVELVRQLVTRLTTPMVGGGPAGRSSKAPDVPSDRQEAPDPKGATREPR